MNKLSEDHCHINKYRGLKVNMTNSFPQIENKKSEKF